MNYRENARVPAAAPRVLVVRNHPSETSPLFAIISVVFAATGILLAGRAIFGASDAFGSMAQGAIGLGMIGFSIFGLREWRLSVRTRVRLTIENDELIIEIHGKGRIAHRLTDVRGAHVRNETANDYVLYTTCIDVAKGPAIVFDERPHWLRKSGEQAWSRAHYEGTADTINRFLAEGSRQ